ncbi:hypothetical protein FOA43_003032 [Brettanomyces nanus]|uniref:Uncharacterized protein n=1 Tax=Eeniella nana TaxID=13502 RepID=A0A875S449_EENNA|nr:uncharacterized protein FOA43_003032 [Brettanomyces nanus]QPG75673.1 hypothetical protein FOA43_003032 [Brettanomyces nanus]
MITVNISSATKAEDHYAYNIVVTVTKASGNIFFKASRRYSDFDRLRKSIEEQTKKKLPYNLPSKLSNLFKRTSNAIDRRRIELSEFSRQLLNDSKYQTNISVLEFFNIPKTTFMKLDNEVSEKRQDRVMNLDGNGTIESSGKWIESLKDVKSVLQNVRTKMYTSNANIVDIKSLLKICQHRVVSLETYLKSDTEIGAGEYDRRRDMLRNIRLEYEELDSSATSFISQRPLDETIKEKGSIFRSHRTLGQPRETEVTKSLDNKQLYQGQQIQMVKQDEQLERLHGTIQRQKQLGMAIHEELDVQNEILKDLNHQVDKSSDKMQHARRNIAKII